MRSEVTILNNIVKRENLLYYNNVLFDLFYLYQLSCDAFCIVGIDGHFQKVNAAFLKLLQFSEEEIINECITDFVHKDDVTTVRQIAAELIDGKASGPFEIRL